MDSLYQETDIIHLENYYEAEKPSTSSGSRISMNNNTEGWTEELDMIDPNENENIGLTREIIFKKIKRMFIGKSSKECTICFNPYNKGELIRRLPCKHIFHEGCVIPWLSKNTKCPNCRFDLKEHFSEMENINEN